MEIRTVEFQFKGKRDYVQGADIFNAMVAGRPAAALANIRFTVHGFVRAPLCRLYLSDTKQALNDVADVRARCNFDARGVTWWSALTQIGEGAAGGRHEYDEERIISLCRMESRGIVLTQASPFSLIENVVAMNKHMHQVLLPDAVGKWIFTRIDLASGCDERAKLALRLGQEVNYRLTRSEILVDGKKAGDLFFSLMKS